MKHPRILTVGIASLLAWPAILHAADRNWTGLGAPGTWTDAANWSTGVPTSGTGDNIFIHSTGSVTGVAIDANQIYLGTGTPGTASSGFTFGTGTSNIGFVAVGEGHNGVNPTSNRFGRAFINAGTTLNVGNFFVGDWDGGTGQVVQSGGDVNISNQFRVGHWPQTDVGAGTVSTYTLNGGSITVSGSPSNPFDEGQAGNVFLGIDSTAYLTINAGTFTSAGITLDNRGATAGEDTLEINGGALNLGQNGIVSQNATNPGTYEVRLKGGIIVATASSTSTVEMTLVSGGSGIHYDTNGNTVTLSGNLIGTGGLAKDGAGTLLLTGTNSFSGGLVMNAGTLQVGDTGTTGSVGTGAVTLNAGTDLAYNRTDALTVPGAISGSGALNVNSGTLRLANASGSLTVTVNAGATLGVAGTLSSVLANSASALEAGVNGVGNLTAGTINLTDTTLKLSVGATNTRFIVTNPGGLIANGSNVIDLTLVNLTAGTYTLVDYAGAIGGAGYASFSLTGLPSRAVGGLVNNTGNTSIDLNITAIDYPKWSGAVNSTWDGTTQNWRLVIGGGPTNYQNLDAVLFDDTATGTTTVDLSGAFTPSSVVINNPTKTYTFTGAGSISGNTGLKKQGAGRAIIANTNDYTGPTDVQAGTLQLGDGSSGSLGTATTVTIAAAGTVELDLPANYDTPTTGAGTLRTINANSFDIVSGILTGTPTLNIAGASTQIIGVNNQPAFNGNISITGGTLRVLGIQALGTTAAGTAISDGATLDLNAIDIGAEAISVSGTGVDGNGAIVNNAVDTYNNVHKIVLTGDASFGGTHRWDIRPAGVAGEGLDLNGHRLTKVGPSQVSLVDLTMTAGDLDINSGTFSIENNALVQGSGTIALNPGGTLGLWVNQPSKLTRQIAARGGSITELGSAGTTTVDAPISLEADLNYSVFNGATVLNQLGNITESGGPHVFTKSSDGRLVLLGNNTWTGGTVVNGGILQIGAGGTAGTLGTGPMTVNGILRFARTDTFTLADDVNAGGPSGQFQITAGGTVTLASGTDVKLTQVRFGLDGVDNTIGGTLNVGPGTSLTVGDSLAIGNSGGGGTLTQGVINQTGGTVDVNSPGTDGRQFVLGHWGTTNGIYNLVAGSLNAPNISMAISWDGDGTFTQSGGIATMKGLRFGHNPGRVGHYNLTGGELILGSEGIWSENTGFPNDINFGGGIVRFSADAPITEPVELTGINGNVTIDTDVNTVTVTGNFFGNGGLTKIGDGRLIFEATNAYTGTTTVNDGTLEFAASQTLTSLVIGPGGTVELTASAPGAAPMQAVPEPGAIGLLTTGMLGLLGARRRRR